MSTRKAFTTGLLLATGLLVGLHSTTMAQDANPLSARYVFPYDLREPSLGWVLPMFLEEISALSWDPERNMLVTLEDESGNLFYLQDGRVVQELEFWKDGDYEGVEVVGKDVFVLKSSGTLYHVRQAGSRQQELEKYNDFLNPDYDVEGLGIDPAGNRLLLACKGMAGEGDEFKMKKAVYAFRLDRMELEKDPAYLISFEDVHQFLETSPSIRKWEKLMEFFQPNDTDFTFSPSGLAVTPDGTHIYILSTAGKYVLVLDYASGNILHIEKLSKKMHPQPEGICFDELGNLYISNEGKGGMPTLYRFAPRAD